MNKMRLLVFHPAIAPYRIDFFNNLYDRFDASICLYYKNLKSQTFDYEKIEKKLHFKPDYFEKSIRLGKRSLYLGHIRRIRKCHPDVVIVGEYGPGLWTAVFCRLFFRKRYRIITICDDSLKIAKDCTGLRRFSRDLAIKFIDGIILCNDNVCEWYNRHFKTECFVFPIIQYENEFYRDRPQAISMAEDNIKKYDLFGKRVFLFVGRLAPEKNLQYLVSSFISAHAEHPENVLFIVGGQSRKDPELNEKLKKIILDGDAEDYIYLLGRKEGTELKAWYYIAQIFVLPSTYEPFGAVVNEALLAGEYVMVSSAAGSSCLVTDENGCVIDVNRPQIDLESVSKKVMPLKEGAEHTKERMNRMPFTYDEKMNGLIEWISGF